MMGVKEVTVEEIEVRISYELMEATAEQIERTLLQAGARLADGWMERLQRVLVHYTEHCETANLEVSKRGHHHYR